MNDYVNEELEKINKQAEDYSRELREYGKLSLEHDEIGIKSRENIEMIRKHNMEVKEREQLEKEREQIRQERKEKVKRTRRKSNVIMALLVAGVTSLGTLAFNNNLEHLKGRESIANSFYSTCMEGISYRDDSQAGYLFVIDGEYVPYEEAVKEIGFIAENDGYSDVQTYIALSAIFNSNFAKDVVGEKPDRKEIRTAEKQQYLEDKLEEVKTNGK